MIRKIAYVTVLVTDQDEALEYYTEKLSFVKRVDQKINYGFRWLVVSPKDQTDVGLILKQADGEELKQGVGKQAGGGVLMMFYTNDCKKTYGDLKGTGVDFTVAPKEQPWGLEAIFKDLYGNHFALVQPKGWGG